MLFTFSRGEKSQLSQSDKVSVKSEFCRLCSFHGSNIFNPSSTIHSANRLKSTAKFSNFPWSQPWSGSNETTQFISAHFQLDMTLKAGGQGFYEDTQRKTTMRFSTAEQKMEFEFEKGYLVDGIPFNSDQSISGPPVNFSNILNDIPLSTHIGIGICSQYFGHWREAIYDPQLSSIFLQPPSPNTPESPTEQKHRYIAAIVGSVVAVVVVAAIVATIIVVVRSPSLKAKCMPSYARESAFDDEEEQEKKKPTSDPRPATAFTEPQRASSPTAESKDHGWQKSTRPTV